MKNGYFVPLFSYVSLIFVPFSSATSRHNRPQPTSRVLCPLVPHPTPAFLPISPHLPPVFPSLPPFSRLQNSGLVSAATFNNSAPLRGGGGGVPTFPPPPPPAPPQRLRQIFFRAFSRSKIFSGAFGPNWFTPTIFFGASKNSAPLEGGGGGWTPAPPLKRSPVRELVSSVMP